MVLFRAVPLEKLNVLLKDTSAGHMAADGHSGYKPATTWL